MKIIMALIMTLWLFANKVSSVYLAVVHYSSKTRSDMQEMKYRINKDIDEDIWCNKHLM